MNDVKFACRQLLKNPCFTAVAIVTLALGIGANTAIFSVVNTVLLKPLPYRDFKRIVMLWTDNAALNIGIHELPPTPTDLIDWRLQAQSFDEIAGIRPRTADISEQGDPERVGGVQVSANFFSLLGVQPLLGRTFSPEEEQPANDKVATISYSLWQRRFGGDTNVLARTITINRERHRIVGVMPPGFSFPRGAEMPVGYGLLPETEVWRPFADNANYWRNDDTRDFIAIGRLRPGVTLQRAQAEMDGVAQHQAGERPGTHKGWSVHLRPLAKQVVGKTGSLLLMLLGAVAFVLLIACANVANLLLCRAAARRKEMAVRAAIGAAQSRIIRQLLTESLMLSFLGGGLGFVLGAQIVRLVLALGPQNLPRMSEISLDWHVLSFATVLSLATGVIFGLAPAWHASRINLSETLNVEGRLGSPGPHHRSHSLLVMSELALAIILLTGTALMVQSFRRLESVDTGFKPQRVVAFDVSLFGSRYDNEARVRQFFRDARSSLSKVPGVQSAAAISSLPLGGVESMQFLFVEGAPLPVNGRGPITESRRISPGYFGALGINLLQGRDFNDRDTAEIQKVCIINETIARAFFPGADPVGKRLKLAGLDKPWITIAGVVKDVRGYSLELKPRPQVYVPFDQDTQNEMTFVVRAEAGPARALEKAIRSEMKSLDNALPLANFRTMEQLVSSAIARPRFSALLLGLFAGTALLLTVVGLYGVVAYAASQRTREVGIRLALGASERNILNLIIQQGMRPALVGLALGIAGALGLTRLLASQLYEIKPTDPVSFASAALLLSLVALIACYLPARRATKVDPIQSLRYE